MKLFEKDGVTFQVYSVLEEARLKKAGYKEVKPEKTPEEKNAEEVEKVNKKKGGA